MAGLWWLWALSLWCAWGTVRGWEAEGGERWGAGREAESKAGEAFCVRGSGKAGVWVEECGEGEECCLAQTRAGESRLFRGCASCVEVEPLVGRRLAAVRPAGLGTPLGVACDPLPQDKGVEEAEQRLLCLCRGGLGCNAWALRPLTKPRHPVSRPSDRPLGDGPSLRHTLADLFRQRARDFPHNPTLRNISSAYPRHFPTSPSL